MFLIVFLVRKCQNEFDSCVNKRSPKGFKRTAIPFEPVAPKVQVVQFFPKLVLFGGGRSGKITKMPTPVGVVLRKSIIAGDLAQVPARSNKSRQARPRLKTTFRLEPGVLCTRFGGAPMFNSRCQPWEDLTGQNKPPIEVTSH